MFLKTFILMTIQCLYAIIYAQQSKWDSLDIQYEITHTHLKEKKERVFGIKLPPYLMTKEVMRQIKLVIHWPGTPLPAYPTTVHVYRDDAHPATISRISGKYHPQKGFQWDLKEWIPDTTIYSYHPSILDKLIYNTILDSFFSSKVQTAVSGKIQYDQEQAIKKTISGKFNKTLAETDSIFYRVKWWQDLQKRP